MRSAGKIIVWSFMIVMLASCSKMNPADCFKNAGQVSTESRPAESFRYLHMQNNVDVFLTYSNEYSIEVRAGKNIIPGIKTRISDNTLTISNENTCNWLRSYDSPLAVYLGVPLLDSIVYQSSGNLTTLNKFAADSIQIDVLEGAGSIDLWLDTHKSRINLHYGTVDLKVRGHSHISYLYSAGYGPADLSSLETEFTYMTNNSTNICRVRARLELHVEIFNVGDVYYSGDPAEIGSWITGTGRLIKEN
ncbi:MAG TPA: DUF2807 domain-containing protein [Bacteroidales bacterium]|nr:DUF2807 domain-containing protein [Bacteroidales bacterium]